MVYLDDIIIYSTDINSHFKTLREVLEKLRNAGLKIKVKKCQFLKKSLEYLGHVVTEEGIKMQEGKIKSICDYPAPTTVKGVRRFLGMAGYYRPFIQNSSTVAKPLTELTKKDVNFKWTKVEQSSFDMLKVKLTEQPVLVYPDFTKEFYIACDASSTGLGAVLLQKYQTRMRAVHYASRVLNSAERNYSTTEKECLAVYWALKKFRHLILGYQVKVLTDHKPICDLFKKRAFTNNQKFNRWFVSVLEFSHDFKHIPGKWNTIADGLSRSHEENEKMISTRSFCFSCQVVDLDMEMVRKEQLKEKSLKSMIHTLSKNRDVKSDCELINGVLYR